MEIDKDRKTYKAVDIYNTEDRGMEINRGIDIDRDNENGDKEIDKDMNIVTVKTVPDTKISWKDKHGDQETT